MKIWNTIILISLVQFCIAQDELEKLYYPSIHLSDVPYEFAAQIHSLDDFIKRFNGINNGIGKPYDVNSQLFKQVRSNKDSWLQFRRNVIISLFDKSFYMAEYEENSDFVEYLLNYGELTIDKNQVLAAVQFTTLYDCRMVFGALILRLDGSNEMGYEWKVDDVIFEREGVPENIVKKISPIANSGLFIPPNAQDNNFIYLHKRIREQKDLAPFIQSTTKGISEFHHLMRYPEFSIEFTSTRFMIKVANSKGFTLDKNYKIIARVLTASLN